MAIVYGRVKKLRSSIAKVSYDNGLDDIALDDYRMIDSVLMILEPIQNFEKKLQQECLPTISLVYGGIHAIMQLFDNLTVRASLMHGALI